LIHTSTNPPQTDQPPKPPDTDTDELKSAQEQAPAQTAEHSKEPVSSTKASTNAAALPQNAQLTN
jgi:hypothetical protein